MISTITGTVTSLVTPGSGNYAALLTIASTGVINESLSTAISASTINSDIINFGQIDGAIWLGLDGTLNNSGIASGTTVVTTGFSGVVLNSGTIAGTQVGVNLGVTSRIVNSGYIGGGNIGIYAPSGGYVLNNGTIHQGGGSGGFEQFGVALSSASLNNTGLIYGFYSVLVANSSVTNSGTIFGSNVGLVGSGTSTVQNTGKILGAITGIAFASGTLANSGSISAIVAGINASGNVLINNSGFIYGSDTAIGLTHGGEVINAGTITSPSKAILNSSTSAALTLVVEAGAHFNGQVADNSNHGILLLEGTTAGSLDLGGSFSGFSEIGFASGTTWTLEGSIQELANGETITGLGQGDTIILDGFTATSSSFVSGTGLILSNGHITETLDVTSGLGNTTLSLVQTGSGTVIEALPAPCFCAGTRIATARGNIEVEHLRIGDLVKTATQGFQPIRWIGQRAYEGRFIAGNHLALPVKIRRHAFGLNLPARDLYVSPDHGICEGGVLVHAWRFVNGVSITQAAAVERVQYFHIELDRHAVIFAESLPVESFLDTGCRNRFHNAQSAPAASSPQPPCLTRIEDGYYLARLKTRIDARAGIKISTAAPGPLHGCIDEAGPTLRGWAQDTASPEQPVELELLCGRSVMMRFLANRYRADLRAAGLGSGCHAFALALPALPGPFTLRRAADGAPLGANQEWMATRRAG